MPKIVLNRTENDIRTTLISFAKKYSETTGKPLTLRITGGWVRDKLLNRSSHDIDVAIDNATGEEFATALHDYLLQHHKNTDSVHVIARNPEKSKHLETATTKVCGLEVDFVNLRSEKYTENSRIPIVSFGTPYEDAHRRDATVNALFYNLEKEEIEDFTSRGLEDLDRGLLRTPLNARETFQDDPLRILRLIRFAAQLNFKLADDAQNAMTSADIKSKLVRKVSKERVGIELGKLLSAEHVVVGLKYIAALDLAPYIFSLPQEYTPIIASWKTLDQYICQANSVVQELIFPFAQDKFWLSILLKDWAGLQTQDAKKKAYPGAFIAVKEAIKLPKDTALSVSNVVNNADEAWDLALRNQEASRLEIGRFVRKLGANWPLCLALAAAIQGCVYPANELYKKAHIYNVADAYLMRPLLSGKDVMKLFSGRKPGEWLSQVLNQLIDYQLENSEATTEDARRYVQNTFNYR